MRDMTPADLAHIGDAIHRATVATSGQGDAATAADLLARLAACGWVLVV
jgi:hypothetical protein